VMNCRPKRRHLARIRTETTLNNAKATESGECDRDIQVTPMTEPIKIGCGCQLIATLRNVRARALDRKESTCMTKAKGSAV
jgi:hypothetical protein